MSADLVMQPPKSDLSQLLDLLESGESPTKVSDSLPSTRPPSTSQQQLRSRPPKSDLSKLVELLESGEAQSNVNDAPERKRPRGDCEQAHGQVKESEWPSKRPVVDPAVTAVANGEAPLPDGYLLVYVRTVRVQTSSRRTGFRSDEPTNVQIDAHAVSIRSVTPTRHLSHVHHVPDHERDFRPLFASTQASPPPEEARDTPPITSRAETAPPHAFSLLNLDVPATLLNACRELVINRAR